MASDVIAQPKHYYVTEDLESIITRWCKSRKLNCVPTATFAKLREELTANLAVAFSQPVDNEETKTRFEVRVRYVPRTRLRTLTRADNDGEFWISLDDVFVSDANYYLKLCRLYDEDGIKIGVGSRKPSDSVEQQLMGCEQAYAKRDVKQTTVVLADDGTYSGGSIVAAARLLDARGIRVDRVNLGLCTDEGVTFILNNLPGVELGTALLVDKTQHMFTWICERDFYLGAPRSGRPLGARLVTSATPSVNPIAFPYLEPFAASRRGGMIKRGLVAFSKKQILSSLDLWTALEKANGGVRFKVEDIPRFPGPGLEAEYARYKDHFWTDYVRTVAGLMHSSLSAPEGNSQQIDGSGRQEPS